MINNHNKNACKITLLFIIFYISMQKIIFLSFFVVAVFLLFKYLEAKYIDHDTKPLKLILRDAIMVFVSSVTSLFLFFYFEKNIMDFFDVVTENKNHVVTKKVNVFVGEPGF